MGRFISMDPIGLAGGLNAHLGVRELSISQWGHDNTEATFRFTSEGGAAFVAIDCKNGASLAFVCDWVRVEGVTYGHLGSP
jgi:hypothetical protein